MVLNSIAPYIAVEQRRCFCFYFMLCFVDLRIDRGDLRGMFALSGMRIDICNTLSKNVDLLTAGSLDEDFRRKISEDEVLIYERA